jgi:hypothetical protein
MKEKISALIFGMVTLLFMACSSGSDSGTNANNPASPSVSSCSLANAYLPEYSLISYKDAFGGGCQANATMSVEQATEYSNLLVANGFEQATVSVDLYNYKKNVNIDSTVLVTLSYSQNSLIASVQEAAREYIYEDRSVVAENFIYPDLCIDSWKPEKYGSSFIYCNCREIEPMKMLDLEWKYAEGSFYYQYNENYYRLHRTTDALCYVERFSIDQVPSEAR